jgi:hypothetical protein
MKTGRRLFLEIKFLYGMLLAMQYSEVGEILLNAKTLAANSPRCLTQRQERHTQEQTRLRRMMY